MIQAQNDLGDETVREVEHTTHRVQKSFIAGRVSEETLLHMLDISEINLTYEAKGRTGMTLKVRQFCKPPFAYSKKRSVTLAGGYPVD